MPRRVTMDEVRRMNEIYYKCHSYAETARQVGYSASTVRNYIDPNFNPVIEDEVRRFNPDTDMPQFSTQQFVGVDNYGDLCALSDEEIAEIKELWKEIAV